MAQEYQNRQHNDERRSDLAVLDANEYKQKRRLERILDALDDIDETADRAKERFVYGEITRDGRNIMVQDAVNDAIYECWNLLKAHEQDCQEGAIEAATEENGEENPTIKYLRENGSWPHSPYFTGMEGDPIGTVTQMFDDDIVVRGLSDFFELAEMWTESWESTSKGRGGGHEVTGQEVTHTVPESLSWAAAIRLKEFLNDVHDMEIQFEEMDDTRPYDDWREEFESGVYRGPDGVDLPHKKQEDA